MKVKQEHSKITRLIILTTLAVGTIACLVFTVMAGKAYITTKNERALLDKNGVAVKATVFRKEKNHSRKLNITTGRYRDNSNYLLHMRFDANSEKGTLSFNKALRGEKQDFDLTFDYRTIIVGVGESTYHSTKIGDKDYLKYLPDDPSIYEFLDEDGEYNNGNYFLFYAFIFLLLTGVTAGSFRQYYTTGTTW